MVVAPHGTSSEDGIDHVDEYETESENDSDNDLVLAEAESELDVLSPDLSNTNSFWSENKGQFEIYLKDSATIMNTNLTEGFWGCTSIHI